MRTTRSKLNEELFAKLEKYKINNVFVSKKEVDEFISFLINSK